MIVCWYGSFFPRSAILDRHISGILSPLRGAKTTQVQYAGRASRSDRVVTAPTETSKPADLWLEVHRSVTSLVKQPHIRPR